ncbi:MAG: prepilin peptidase [Planctomycetota bacterium]
MISYPVELFSAFWLFMVGASIGSFLNVVAYRLPGGLTLLGSSHCPKCHMKIRASDNIPVFAWIKRMGKCWNCQLPISVRYPVVEALCGIVFLTIGIADFAFDGANIPGISSPFYPGFSESMIRPQLENLALFLIHATLMTLLLACSLIEYDGHRAVGRLMILLLVGGILAMVVSPAFPTRESAMAPKYGANLGRVFSGLAAGDGVIRVYGIVVGALVGFVISSVSVDVNASAEEKMRSATLHWALVGLWLGMFQILSIFLVAVALRLVGQCFRATTDRPKIGRILLNPIALLFLSTWLHILLWSRLGRLPNWPINGYTGVGSLFWIFGGCILLLLASLFNHRRRRGSPFAKSEL